MGCMRSWRAKIISIKLCNFWKNCWLPLATFTKNYSIPLFLSFLVNFLDCNMLILIYQMSSLNRILYVLRITNLLISLYILFIKHFVFEDVFPNKCVLYFLDGLSILRKHAKKWFCVHLLFNFFTIVHE